MIFRVHYATQWGENLWFEFCGSDRAGTGPQTYPMHHEGNGFWSVQLEPGAPGSALQYRYEFRDCNGNSRREPVCRRVEVVSSDQAVWDHFLAPELPDGAFLRQAFAGVIFDPVREALPSALLPGSRRLRITIRAPRVPAGHRLCISGGHPLLGEWDPARAQPMSGSHYPSWELDLPGEQICGLFEFKFGLWDESRKRLVEWEAGPNRVFHGLPPGAAPLVVNYEQFWHPEMWRGAGVAIPVFSLRSETGYGIGEFADLAAFAEWAALCGLHLVQVLPVNDTSSDFTWRDSYPYKSISTAALHPVYLNLERVFAYYGADLPPDYAARRAALNRLPQIDYETVIKTKLAYLRGLFDRTMTAPATDPGLKDFVRDHEHWLFPYAAFCRLRDLHGTADFTQWGPDAVYRERELRNWFSPGAPEYPQVMFQCWLQYHLDRQLGEAVAAGHARGVAFKGDLPIGVDRSSVEVWTQPELFRLDRQTGAPPDAFSALGQNWRFPTYNWGRMEEDHYEWWRRRFRRMSTAFDALRIDHILGFFRIWEIPIRYQEGILGHFNPALPLSRAQIARAGFTRDPKLYAETQPLPERESPTCSQPSTKTQRAVRDANDSQNFDVLFLEDPDQPDHFHPRINLADTAVFSSLPPKEQAALRCLHDDYFYHRHTQFWADEALRKLPVLMDASPMLICGEDLGMVPESVPIVLKRLGLLSLEVQRWPKVLGRHFGNPRDYPYLSVCTTSTHDMSTVRGWWEEEPEARQLFWTEAMGRNGTAPVECSAAICRSILQQNLGAPSMWCILPLQDWLGIDARLRHPDAAAERINVPAIPRHYWRYRMHLTIESLLQAKEFNAEVASLVRAAARAPDFGL